MRNIRHKNADSNSFNKVELMPGNEKLTNFIYLYMVVFTGFRNWSNSWSKIAGSLLTIDFQCFKERVLIP
jgi:hypothetical protein